MQRSLEGNALKASVEGRETSMSGTLPRLFWSSLYTDALSEDARFPRERYRLVRQQLFERQLDLLEQVEILSAEEATRADCLLAHDAGYVDRFLQGELNEKEMRRIGLRPWTERMVKRTLVLTNGTIQATHHVLQNPACRWSGNIGGGTHHAYTDFGSGYCIVNDLAIAARVAQRDYEDIQRVLILDLDVHQGDGTAQIFEEDPSVRTISFHAERNFPFRKMTSDLDIALPDGVEDREYLQLLEDCLTREVFQPDLIFYQAGADPLATDRLGHLALTREGLRMRNRLVFDYAAQCQAPLVITMGGGYGEPLETSIDAHADLFLEAIRGDKS